MANELFIKHKIIDVTPDLVEDGSIYFERSTNLIKVVESDSSIITVGVKKGTGVNSAILNDPNNIASGENALAQGSNSTASGQCAHAEGSSTQATGEFSHSEGYNTVAAGKYSHAEGYGTETKNEGEHAQGRWNVSSDTPGYETIHTIGYGTGSSNRKNIYELHRTGKQFIIGLGDYDGTNASTAKSVQQVIADLTTLVTANSDLYLIDKVQSGSIDEWIGGWDNVVLAIENKKLFGITDSTNSYNSKNRVIFPAMVDRYPQNVIKWSYLYQDPVADTGYSINTITITKSDDNTLSKQEQSFSLGGDVDSLISVSDSMVQVGNGTDTINLKTYNRPYVNNNEQLAYLSDVEDILEPYTVNLTNLLSAQDSESISTAIGGIDNLNATVTKNQVIFGTLANGTVAVGIRVLGNQTTLTYFVDSLVGLTVNEVIITNTSGTLSKTVNTHSVLTENLVINSLESDETTLPLSAAQGKVLNEKILNSGKVYVIDGIILSEDSPTSEQISEAIGGWDNLVNAIQNNYIIAMSFSIISPDSAHQIMPVTAVFTTNHIIIAYVVGTSSAHSNITNTSGTLSISTQSIALLNESDYSELQTTDKTIIGALNEINTLANSKADSQDITNAINALDKAEVSAGTGEIISAVSQENGIVNVSKRSLTSNDIPTLPQSKIEDLSTDLDAKQNATDDTLGTTDKTIVGAINEILPKATGVGKIGSSSDGTGEIFNDYINNKASGKYAHAEGLITNASGDGAHAEGNNTTASNFDAHAEGYATTASGQRAHAEGNGTTASGHAAHAEGIGTTASGEASHAEGYNIIASGDYAHAEGKWNFDDSSAIHMVGIGTVPSDKKNAHAIKSNGEHFIIGIGGYEGKATDSAQSLQEVVNGKQDALTRLDVPTLFADSATITSELSSQIAAYGGSTAIDFPLMYAGTSIGNIKPIWIRTTSGVTNMMCIADNKIWYFEIQGTTVQRAELAIS